MPQLHRTRRARLRAVGLVASLAVCAGLLSTPVAFAAVDTPVIDETRTTTGPTGDVLLAWSHVEGATGYRVAVATSATFESGTVLYDKTTTALQATPDKVLPSGTLHWRVVAQEGLLSSPPVTGSFQRAVVPGPVLRSPGAESTALLHYPSEPPVLVWEPVPGAKSYTVELSTDDTFPAGGTQSFTTSATSYAVSGLLTRGTAWSWRVRAALNGDGKLSTDHSATGSFRIDWPQSVPELEGDAATPEGGLPPTVTDVDLRWSAVPGAARYKVQVSTDPEFATAVPGTPVTVPTNRYAPARSFDNGAYFWKVTAVDPAGNEGPPSRVHQFTRSWNPTSEPTMPDPQRVAAPRAVSVTGAATPTTTTDMGAVSLSDLELTWTPVPRASVYEVWVTSETSNFFTDSRKILKCYTPHTSTGSVAQYQPLSASTWARFVNGSGCLATLGRTAAHPVDAEYRWRVRALDLGAADTATHQVSPLNVDGSTRFIRSGWSDAANSADPAHFVLLTPRAGDSGLTPSLTAPADCPPHSACAAHPDAPTLVWRPVDGAVAGYWVELALDSSFTNKVGEFHTVASRLRLDGGLLDNAANQAYYWRVMGCTSFTSFSTKSCLQSGSANIRSFLKKGSAPQDLRSASAGDHLSFAWQEHLLTSNQGGGTRGYEVEVATDELFSVNVLRAKVDQPFLTTSAALLQDGAYFWRVRALDGAAVPLPWAVAGPVTKSASRPEQSPSLSGPTAPALHWSSVPGTASYDLQVFNGTNLSGSPVYAVSRLGSTAHVPTSLAPGSYSWRVRRNDVSGNVLPWSAEAGGDVRTFAVGSGPVSPIGPQSGETLPLLDRVLSWDAVPGAVRYRVQLSTSSGFSTVVETAETTQTTHAVGAAVTAGTTYHWRVLPLHGTGQLLTGDAVARAVTFWTVPSAAQTVKAVTSGRTITVSWAAPATSGGTPLTGYVLRYRPTGAETWTLVRVSASTTSQAVEKLEAGTSYQFAVASTSSQGTGPFSALLTQSTHGLPTAPTVTGAVRENRAATVAWSVPTTDGGSPITAYTVTSAPGGVVANVAGSARSAVVSGLTNGVTYTFTVKATNAVGTGPSSQPSGEVVPASTAGRYLPLDPVRVLSGQAVGPGGSYTLQLDGVPVGATAATFNLAAAGVTGNTYVTACPGGTSVTACKQKASLNTNKRDRSNLVTVKLGGDATTSSRSVLLYNNVGSVMLFADLQGYHVDPDLPGASGTVGSTYTAADPTRVLSGQRVGKAGTHLLTLEDVPVGATAVTFNLAAAGVTANTYVTACPGSSTVDACRQQASLNAVPGVDTANLVTVTLGGDPTSTRRTVRLYNNAGDVLLFADLQGFYVPFDGPVGSAGPEGSTFSPTDPTRVLSGQALDHGGDHVLNLTNVPLGATAVAFNLAAAGVTGNTYVSACPGGTTVQVCNQKANLLTGPGADAAVFVVVKLGGDPSSRTRTVRLYNNVGDVLLYADLQGYFV